METKVQETYCNDAFAKLDKKFSMLVCTPGYDDISVRYTGYASTQDPRTMPLLPSQGIDSWLWVLGQIFDGNKIQRPLVRLTDIIVQDWQELDSSFRAFSINGNYFPMSGEFTLSWTEVS